MSFLRVFLFPEKRILKYEKGVFFAFAAFFCFFDGGVRDDGVVCAARAGARAG